MVNFRMSRKYFSATAAAVLAFSPILPGLPGTILNNEAKAATTTLPYVLDAANHTLTLSPAADATSAVSSALNYLTQRADKDVKWTLKFKPGNYGVTRAIRADYLQNVDLVSDKNSPAVFIKAPTMQSEYILYFRFAKTISMSGFTFYGKTRFESNSNPVWTDQGVYFGSCNGVNVEWNKFYNFGNAALRVTTDNYDPVKGVNSFNTRVYGNIFNNVYQISTTSNDDIHGATANYSFEYNSVYNLRASVKFASRTPGAKNVKVMYNIFKGSDIYGLEIDNYTDFYISSNTFENIKSVAINAYTNERAQEFAWGDNFTIYKNKISDSGRGIRFSPNAYPSGFTFVPKNLKIMNNTLANISATDPYVPAIGVFKGKVDGVTITGNTLSGLTNGKAVGYTTGCTNLNVSGNTLDAKEYVAIKF